MKVGSSVTWGSGLPVGKVVRTFRTIDEATGADSPWAKVVLTQDLPSPCGRSFSSGLEVNVPVGDLRLLS